MAGAHGEGVQFVSAFAGSGTVANQIIMGVPAEFALLSLELDAQKIAKAGVVPDGSWRKLPHEGVVNRTPFVILTADCQCRTWRKTIRKPNVADERHWRSYIEFSADVFKVTFGHREDAWLLERFWTGN